jgi:hypothetical protein
VAGDIQAGGTYLLSYNGTYYQVVGDGGGGGGGVTDHGALTGLADDDHTQYHNNTRGDARYPQLSGTYNNPSWLNQLAWSKITGAPSFLTSETDPVYSASSWFGTTNNSGDWDAAFSWGDHSTFGYMTATTDGSGTTSNGTGVDLGGATSQVTEITSDGYDFKILRNGSELSFLDDGFGFKSLNIKSNTTGGGAGGVYISDTNDLFFSEQKIVSGTVESSIIRNSNNEIANTLISTDQIIFLLGDVDNSDETRITLFRDSLFINSNISGFGGAIYGADYRSNYTDRTLPDWGNVTTQIGGQDVSSLITTPTSGEDGYAIKWDETNNRYTLGSVSGGSSYSTIQDEGTGLTQRSTLNFTGGGIIAQDNAGNTRTDVSLNATLNALASYNQDGFVVQTASNTFTSRDIAGTTDKITVTNGDGVAGNPTITIGTDVVDKTIANTYTAGAKQTVLHNSTNSGLRIAEAVGNPSSLGNGDIWLNSTDDDLYVRINGTTNGLTRSIIEDVTTTTYTFSEADRNKIKRFTHASGCLATIPDALSLNWSTSVYRATGAGVLTIASDGTLEGAGSTLNTEKTMAYIHHRGSDIHILAGAVGSSGGSVAALDDVGDVTITSIASGELLKWNGTAWENNTLAEAGIQPAGSYLTSEVDGSVTNEGSLTVAAGTATTSIINSNTSGSTGVTIEAGSGISVSETGNTITIAATGGGGGLTYAQVKALKYK